MDLFIIELDCLPPHLRISFQLNAHESNSPCRLFRNFLWKNSPCVRVIVFKPSIMPLLDNFNYIRVNKGYIYDWLIYVFQLSCFVQKSIDNLYRELALVQHGGSRDKKQEKRNEDSIRFIIIACYALNKIVWRD